MVLKNLISERVFHIFFLSKSKQCSENEVEASSETQMFNRVGPGSEQKCKKQTMSASLSHSTVMTDEKAAVNL